MCQTDLSPHDEPEAKQSSGCENQFCVKLIVASHTLLEHLVDLGQKCPVETTVDVTGGKWKTMIIYRLLDGPRCFGELRCLVGNPSQRSLTMEPANSKPTGS